MSDRGPHVVVVGGGPPGLLLAAELQRRRYGFQLGVSEEVTEAALTEVSRGPGRSRRSLDPADRPQLEDDAVLGDVERDGERRGVGRGVRRVDATP